jgi:hypothetical protein
MHGYLWVTDQFLTAVNPRSTRLVGNYANDQDGVIGHSSYCFKRLLRHKGLCGLIGFYAKPVSTGRTGRVARFV